MNPLNSKPVAEGRSVHIIKRRAIAHSSKPDASAFRLIYCFLIALSCIRCTSAEEVGDRWGTEEREREFYPIVNIPLPPDTVVEAGAFAVQAAGAEGRQPPFVGQLRQRVGLVDHLRQFAPPESDLEDPLAVPLQVMYA